MEIWNKIPAIEWPVPGSSYILLALLLMATYGDAHGQPGKRPNILFAISDDQSFEHTGFNGTEWINTPAFDRIAKEGVFFENCYAGSPGCAPSRSALLTGRYPWQNEQAGQHAAGWPDKYIPFVDLLSSDGYHTGYTGKGAGPFRYGEYPLRTQNAAGKPYNQIRYQKDSPENERYTSHISNINYFENFKAFLDERAEEMPFFFWYGAFEPHRSYEKDSWKQQNKSPENVIPAEFLPDTEKIRGDLLDYGVEIDWFDLHLSRMIAYLEEIGELENTVIIITSDNGMPFPGAKANMYEYGIHVPLAISYPDRFRQGRIVKTPVSFIDLAPTILELAGTSAEGMLPMAGESIVGLLEGSSGEHDMRGYAISGRERHSSSRYKNRGYPARAIRKGPYLYIWNMKPDRWPLGAPQRLIPDGNGKRYPIYGIDNEGVHHSEWAFTDIDPSPSKSFIIEHHDDNKYSKYFDQAVKKRPEFELYRVDSDPGCLHNLAGKPRYAEVERELNKILVRELNLTGDPRVTGPDKEIFDSYPRYMPLREFPKPE